MLAVWASLIDFVPIGAFLMFVKMKKGLVFVPGGNNGVANSDRLCFDI
jgi:hypothetical protein